MEVRSYTLFKDEFMQAAQNTSVTQTSREVTMSGNCAAINVINKGVGGAGTLTLTFRVQGSYDGHSWDNLGSDLTQSTFGRGTATITAVTYAFLRVHVTCAATGNTANCIFDVVITVSAQ